MQDVIRKKNAKCNLARREQREDVKKGKHTSFESRRRSMVEALESEMSETLKHKTEKRATARDRTFEPSQNDDKRRNKKKRDRGNDRGKKREKKEKMVGIRELRGHDRYRSG